MSKIRTHYDNLQVKETASDEVIKGAYRYLAQKWHPDKNPNNKERAERVLQIINQAYATLSDPVKRKEHDKWIEKQNKSDEEPTQRSSSTPPYTQEQRRDECSAPPSRVVRPWIRFWARTLDVHIFSIVAGVAIGVAYPSAFAGEMNNQVLGILLLFAWVFAESIFLSSIGTTPGKWLLKIKVEHQSGSVSFDDALKRSLKVWWRGMGIGLPIVTFTANYVAFKNLKKNAETTWDADNGFTVTHENIGVVRGGVAALIIIFVVSFPLPILLLLKI